MREAVHNVLRFWLDRGASGFRMDVINLISKVQSFPDADIAVPGHKYQPGYKLFANGPRLHEWLKELNRDVLSKYDTITVGEMPFVRDEDEIIRVVGAEAGELNMIFAFDLVDIDNIPGDFRLTLHPWDVRDLKRIVNRYASRAPKIVILSYRLSTRLIMMRHQASKTHARTRRLELSICGES